MKIQTLSLLALTLCTTELYAAKKQFNIQTQTKKDTHVYEIFETRTKGMPSGCYGRWAGREAEFVKLGKTKAKEVLDQCVAANQARHVGDSGNNVDNNLGIIGKASKDSMAAAFNDNGVAICSVDGDVTFLTGNKGIKGALSGGPKLTCETSFTPGKNDYASGGRAYK